MFKYIIYGKNLSKFSKLFTFLGKCGLQILKYGLFCRLKMPGLKGISLKEDA